MIRSYEDKYANLALGLADRVRKKVDRFEVTPTLWKLADYLEANGEGKHEQHLIQMGVKWIKELP